MGSQYSTPEKCSKKQKDNSKADRRGNEEEKGEDASCGILKQGLSLCNK